MSPEFNPEIYPAIFEAHVSGHRRMIDELRKDAARRRKPFDPDDYEQILVGVRQDNMQPAWVPRRAFLEHGLIFGRTGSGKTSLLAGIVAQLIRSGTCSVVIVGSKIESALFQGALEESYYAGRRFRWVTNRVGLESFAYNPFAQSHIPWRSVNQRVQPLLKALGLDYGETYGGSWFSSSMEIFLNNLITFHGETIYSFLDLARYCSDPNLYTNGERKLGTKDDWKNSRHLHHEIVRLAGWEPGQVKSTSKAYPPAVFESAIDVAQLFSEPQVVYQHLSSIGEDVTSRNIAKLMLYGALEVADIIATAKQKGENVRSVPVIFIFDEFAPLVSATFLPVLGMARSLGLGCLMGLQSLHQLSLGDKDFTNTFIAGTGYKHLISAQDVFTQEYVVKSSGETERPGVTWRQTVPKGLTTLPEHLLSPRHAMPNGLPFVAPEMNVRNIRSPRLSMEDVMAYGADRFSTLCSTAENYGGNRDNGRWVPLWNGYHIDKDTYERRTLEPFPSGTEGCLQVRPFSEHDLRYQTLRRGSPVPRTEESQDSPMTVAEIVRRLRGE